MNTDTGNIFAILNGEPLAKNEVELTAEQFKQLLPIRSLPERLEFFRRMQGEPKDTPEATHQQRASRERPCR